MTQESTIKFDFSTELLNWHAKNGRHQLPWVNAPAYHVWLSEIMLQQTQVKTVLPYFLRFIKRFPTIQSLAQADIEEVLPLWQGLGYYRRAHYLHRGAQLWATHGMPQTYVQWQTLPGVGSSTAAALASFIQKEHVSIHDGNVIRVIARLYGWQSYQQAFKNFLQTLLPSIENRDAMPRYTQALMDFGATVCTKKPACLTPINANICPFMQHCHAYQHHLQMVLPVKTPKKSKKNVEIYYLFLAVENHTNQKNSQTFLWQKNSIDGIWPNLYVPLHFTHHDELLKFVKNHHLSHFIKIGEKKHELTHQSMALEAYFATFNTLDKLQIDALLRELQQKYQDLLFLSLDEIKQKAMPKPIADFFELLLAKKLET